MRSTTKPPTAKVELEIKQSSGIKRIHRNLGKNDNLFDVLMDAVRVCSLGEITHALFEVGGRYRRNV